MSQNNLPRCAHYISKYLPLTENWINKIVVNQEKFTPVFLSRKKENIHLFPIPYLYSLDDFGIIRQWLEIAFFKIFGYFNFFKTICTRQKVQILHVHFGYHGEKLRGLKMKMKIPMVCSFYGDDAFANQYAGKYKGLFKEADKILVLGPYMRSRLIELGCPKRKISIHHLGIDVESIRYKERKCKKGGAIRFLIASSFVQKKGIDLAVQALSHFRIAYDFSLDIIGDGPQKNHILNEIEKSGIKDRIKLHGYKPYDSFLEMAYQSDVFIQASRTTPNNNKEGTPMALVDAMATGMAVLSTTHSDIPEIVRDGVNGYLAKENDLDSLVSCVQKIFDGPERIEELGCNGREWIKREFNARDQARKLERHYLELLGPRSNNK